MEVEVTMEDMGQSDLDSPNLAIFTGKGPWEWVCRGFMACLSLFETNLQKIKRNLLIFSSPKASTDPCGANVLGDGHPPQLTSSDLP